MNNSNLDFQLERIEDPVVRESFQKVLELIRQEPFISGSWKQFERDLTPTDNRVRHNLGYKPKDVLITSKSINSVAASVDYENTNDTFIYFTVTAPVKLRFIAGFVGG